MTTLKEVYSSIGTWPDPNQLPLVYHKDYNISFLGFEKWSPFDAWKLDKIFNSLKAKGLIGDNQPSPDGPVTMELLSAVNSNDYLNDVDSDRMTVIKITELPALFMIPNFFIQSRIINPLKLQAAGTVLAVGIALERGWALNIGGGMIHSGHAFGAGWCPYDDLTLALHFARANTFIKKAMIIDLGAHQGNGYASNKLHFKDDDLFVVDVYNEVLFPHDHEARKGINVERQLRCGCNTDEYLAAIRSVLEEASAFVPDLILYAAGSNVLEEDGSGQFNVSREGLFSRDRLVFEFARDMQVPICMVVSSGYSSVNAEVVADSIDLLVKELDLS